jgi:lysozyme
VKVSQNCLDLIEKWEGLFLSAYLDPVGIPTIGWGTIRYPNGQKVRIGDEITRAEAEAFLFFEVEEVVKSLDPVLAGINLTQNQFDAIVSLCYNIGVGGFKESTVLKRLKTGDFAGASAGFDLWNKGTVNGVKVVLQGLVNRRKDERELFDKPGAGAEPIEVEESPQDKVTLLEGFRDGDTNIVAAMAGDQVVELLVLKTSIKDDWIDILRQYKNASGFQIAPAGKPIPQGTRIEVGGKAGDIANVANPPKLDRNLLIRGMADDDPGVSGSDIKELQQRLQELGYYDRSADGIFGKGTDAAVRNFQADTFGSGEADGKVGPLTWAKLWGAANTGHVATGTHATGKNFLLLTKTDAKDTSGCVKLKLEHIKDGKSVDSLIVVSGQPRHQMFRKGADSRRGSMEPLPEGQWKMSDIHWAGGKDVYNGRVWNDGLGPAKIFMDYVPVSGTRRSAIEIHIDWNKSTLPGTAGCIGVASIADFKRLVTWLRETDPKDLYVDWGLGIVVP